MLKLYCRKKYKEKKSLKDFLSPAYEQAPQTPEISASSHCV